MRQPRPPRPRTDRPDVPIRPGLGNEPRWLWARLRSDHNGVTSLEYAIMGAFVVAAIAASVGGFMSGLGSLMASAFGKIDSAM